MGRVQALLVSGVAAAGAAASVFLLSSAQAADYNPPCIPPPQCLATSSPTMANPVPQCLNPPGPLCHMPAPVHVPPPPPQIVPVPVPVQEEFAMGWYLRGDIGLAQQKIKGLHNVLYSTATSVKHVGLGFDAAPTFGVGVGYQINNWMRVDATGEYRARANFKGSDNVRFNAGGGVTGRLVDNYTASKSELLFLLNAYLDMGTWWCITPFIGAGVGFARVTIHDFRDDSISIPGGSGTAFGGTASQWNFAYALHAGLAYKVTNTFAVELAYRYVSLGDGVTGDLRTYTGVNNVNNPMHFKGLTSHDFRLGMRWSLDGGIVTRYTAPPTTYIPPPPPVQQQLYIPPQVYQQPAYQPPPQPVYQAPPPVYQPPPQPAYQPPPVYQQPTYQQPLMRRG